MVSVQPRGKSGIVIQMVRWGANAWHYWPKRNCVACGSWEGHIAWVVCLLLAWVSSQASWGSNYSTPTHYFLQNFLLSHWDWIFTFSVHWVLQNLSLMLCSIYHDCGVPCVHLKDYDVLMWPKYLQGCMLIFVQVRGGAWLPQYSTDLAHEVTCHFRVAHASELCPHRGNNVHVRKLCMEQEE